LVQELDSWGVDVVVEDLWADPLDVFNYHKIKLERLGSDNQVDALVLAVGHNEYRGLTTNQLTDFLKMASVLFCRFKINIFS